MAPVCSELWTAISQDAASIIGAHIGKRSGPPTPGTGPTPLHACQGECARPALGTEAGLFAFRAPITHCTATVPLAMIAGSPIARGSAASAACLPARRLMAGPSRRRGMGRRRFSGFSVLSAHAKAVAIGEGRRLRSCPHPPSSSGRETQGHESQEFPQVIARAAPRQSAGTPQGAGLYH